MLFSISILLCSFVGILVGQYFIIGNAARGEDEEEHQWQEEVIAQLPEKGVLDLVEDPTCFILIIDENGERDQADNGENIEESSSCNIDIYFIHIDVDAEEITYGMGNHCPRCVSLNNV